MPLLKSPDLTGPEKKLRSSKINLEINIKGLGGFDIGLRKHNQLITATAICRRICT